MPIDDLKSWTIGQVEPPEFAATGELLVRAFADTYAVKMPEVVMTERRARDLTDFDAKAKKGVTWVARDAALQVVGTVFVVHPGEPDSLAWVPGGAEVKQLATAPAYRGSGLARALMEWVHQDLRRRGCPCVCLHVRQGAHGVGRFYEGLGYRREPGGDVDWRPEVFLEAHYLPLAP